MFGSPPIYDILMSCTRSSYTPWYKTEISRTGENRRKPCQVCTKRMSVYPDQTAQGLLAVCHSVYISSIKSTVMILTFRTIMPEQTVQTQIRLLRVYTVCHSVCILWTPYSMVEPHNSNYRVITTNLLGVRIFRELW